VNSVDRAKALLEAMTLAEKIGQMSQVNGGGPDLRNAVRDGLIGSVVNEVDPGEIAELQRIAREESRLGIPLLIARDVIHGFRTIFPIPIGLSATWDPALVTETARVAAHEAASIGINWALAPMLDVTRDPRWGRIAESPGEDPYLGSVIGTALVRGYQGDDLSQPGSVAACAKHFAGYGAVEGGRDYNSVQIPEPELRDVYLPPFRRAVEAGVASLMSSFSDLNGIPATANAFLLRQILREEWGFEGIVVSDWHSIPELSVHGLTGCDADAAFAAARAGVNIEMDSALYRGHLPEMVADGRLDESVLDELVLPVLQLKFALGLFDEPGDAASALPPLLDDTHLSVARRAAQRSCVLLKNDNGLLPLSEQEHRSIAVIGPLADDGHEQLGTWVFDGQAGDTRTCLTALQARLGEAAAVRFAPGIASTRSRSEDGHAEAVALARDADVAVLVLGEESILSGEAHCRADIGLPGSQEILVEKIAATGTPIVLVVMAGRPLTLEPVIDQVQALLFAWHPGTMGGPAIVDLLFGDASPSAKLPVTFPKMVGQVPIYYAHRNTGRPPTPDTITHIDAIDGKAAQTSLGMSAFYLDAGCEPLFPFGYGLTYTEFEYSDVSLSAHEIRHGESVTVSATLRNVGTRTGTEVAQLYVRDVVASRVRPVRELKGFRRIELAPGESTKVCFELNTADLAFHDAHLAHVVEPGEFQVWIGTDATASLGAVFHLTS
jgi:beta-glucosidase